MSGKFTNITLSKDGCLERQDKLVQLLKKLKLDAAIITHPRYVHYFTGYWAGGRCETMSAFLLRKDGTNVLALPGEIYPLSAVDQQVVFESECMGTYVEDIWLQIIRVLNPHFKNLCKVGCDNISISLHAPDLQLRDLNDALRVLRRFKYPDEVEMIKASLAGCYAAYDRAKEIITTGLTEVELYAQMYAAATKAIGEVPTEFGNDFQFASMGGPPRNRPAKESETAILDIGLMRRGYDSDLCRTYVIGKEPSENLTQAHHMVMQAIDFVETTVRPGVSCRKVYEQVFKMLDRHNGWSFPHHLGHGIGMGGHDSPRINPFWDDTFEVGDVFAAEPAVYGDDLNAGVRIEQNYLVTLTGIERLSDYPTELIPLGNV